MKPYSFEADIFLNAQYVLFNEKFSSMQDFFNYLAKNEEDLLRTARKGNLESLIRLTILSCALYENYDQAIRFGEEALSLETESKLTLGRIWFALGFAHQGNADVSSAKSSFLNSIKLGFEHALTNLGDLVLVYEQNLKEAVRYWKQGRDEFNIEDCAQALIGVETDLNSYAASIQMDDGSIEMIFFNDTPDGFGPIGSINS